MQSLRGTTEDVEYSKHEKRSTRMFVSSRFRSNGFATQKSLLNLTSMSKSSGRRRGAAVNDSQGPHV